MSRPAGEVHDDVVSALRRTAFLLERAQESTYRVAAFRGAVGVVAPLPPEELVDRARTGRLRELPGIGARTAALIEDVVSGREPAYLTDLEASAEPAPTVGAELRAALRGDLHAHTDASDGGSPVEEMAVTAIELGHDYLAITDHSPRLTVANGLSPARLRNQMERIATLNSRLAPFELLTGIEVDILEDGSLDQDPDLLAELDVVVASVHSKLRMERAAMTRRMLTAIANPHTDVLGHCTGRRVRGRERPPSEFDARAVFSACVEHGVAVEINSRPDREDPPDDLLALAVELGCMFAISSDAHAPGQLDFTARGCARAAQHSIPPDRIVNTRDAQGLHELFA